MSVKKQVMNNKKRIILCFAAYVLIIVFLILITGRDSTPTPAKESDTPTAPALSSENAAPGTTEPGSEPGTEAEPTTAQTKTSYMIEGVPTIQQSGLRAGCETYACTMLLQYLGYDMDEYMFADNYLICAPTSWGDDGTHYGPDMYSAMAGTAYSGYGIYAPAMAKSMNNYLAAVDSKQKAYTLEGKTLDELCHEYVDNGIPVMVWATTWMQEPNFGLYSWVVDYVDDEIGRAEIGETVSWIEHEHCLVLIGYDKDNYYFADSYKGAVSCFDKALSQERYEQIGTMAIVVK